MFSTLFSTSNSVYTKLRSLCIAGIILVFVLWGSLLSGCDDDLDSTSGPDYVRPEIALSGFDQSKASGASGIYLDTSSLSKGFVSAVASSPSRLKILVTNGDRTYDYNMVSGQPIVCPLNMGDGTYTIKVMQNTTGDLYIQLYEETHSVILESEFEPFLCPNVFCPYTETSDCVIKANELSANAENEGDVVKNIYTWVTENIVYDTEKATSVAKGYVPDPDETLASGKGICFDYASLTAAMLRSQGIPCKIVMGNVSSGTIYHAWNMIYIDGSWKSLQLTVKPQVWTLIDSTFAAGGNDEFVGDGTNYAEQKVY